MNISKIDDNLIFESIILKDDDGYNQYAFIFVNFDIITVISKEIEII